MASPLITTIIPTYRRPARLKKAIQSVLSQTYPHFQLCIYDNASGDETAAVVKEMAKQDGRIHYYCHAENMGSVRNFQFGLEHVNTPFFSFLSDDDFLLPEFYATALKYFEQFPDAAVCLGAVLDMYDDGAVVDVALLSWPDQKHFSPPQGLFEMIGKYSNWTGALFRSESVKQIGPLDVDVEAIDVDFLFRIAARFPIVISKKPCAVFVRHPTSYSGCIGLKLFWPGWLKMIENLKADPILALEVKLRAEQMLLDNLQNLLFFTGIKYVEKKNFTDAVLTANLLKRYSDKKFKRLFLAMAIKACHSFHCVHVFFCMMLKWRLRFERLRTYLQRKAYQ